MTKTNSNKVDDLVESWIINLKHETNHKGCYKGQFDIISEMLDFLQPAALYTEIKKRHVIVNLNIHLKFENIYC